MRSEPHTTPSRPLGRLEQLLWHFDRMGGVNGAAFAEISGALPERALQSAVEAFQTRYPMLHTRVMVDEQNRPCYQSAPNRPIEILLSAATDWRREIERQMNIPFPPESSPLIRCIWFRLSRTESVLAFIANHVILDGRSSARLFTDFLERLASPSAAKTRLRSDGYAASLETLYPPHLRGFRGYLRLGRILIDGWLDAVRQGPPSQMPDFVPAMNGKSDGRFVSIELDASMTRALIAQTYRHGSGGLHGALAAAQLLALHREFEDGASRRTLALASAVDLRRMLTRPVSARDLGVYLSLVITTHGVDARTDFWHLAREVRSKLYTRIKRGDAHLIWHLLALIPPGQRGERRLKQMLTRGPAPTIISHIGHIDMESAKSNLMVRSLSFVMCPLPTVPLVTVANVLNGRLFATMSYDEATLSSARVGRISERYHDYLCHAAEAV